MKVFLRGLLIAVAVIAVTACSKGSNDKEEDKYPDEAYIQVKADYHLRMALPSSARFVVSLNDKTLGATLDAQAQDIQGKRPPFLFAYEVPTSVHLKDDKYTLSAHVEANGEVILVSDKEYPVINDPNRTRNVNLRLITP